MFNIIDIRHILCNMEYMRRVYSIYLLAFLLCAVLFLCPTVLFCSNLAPPVDLSLTIVISPVGEFTINTQDPIVITLGVPRILTYTFTGNCLAVLTITSAHADGTQMRMKHTKAEAYIPYTMTFDYGDGVQRSVVHNSLQEMLGFSHGEYDVTGSFYIITEASDEYLAGDYTDTMSFLIQTQ